MTGWVENHEMTAGLLAGAFSRDREPYLSVRYAYRPRTAQGEGEERDLVPASRSADGICR